MGTTSAGGLPHIIVNAGDFEDKEPIFLNEHKTAPDTGGVIPVAKTYDEQEIMARDACLHIPWGWAKLCKCNPIQISCELYVE